MDNQEAKTQLSAEGTTNLQPTCNQLATEVISRQAAIATVKNVRKVCDTNDINDYHDLLIEAFNVLPSAQPESYQEKLKEIADELSEKFAYLNTCLNERDIILGYLGVKRPSKIHCDTDCTNTKCECNHHYTKSPSAQPEVRTQMSSADCISRQDAIDALVKAIRNDPYYDSNERINGLGVCDVRVILNDLPSAQPESEERKAESAQNVPKEDLISRKAVIDYCYQLINVEHQQGSDEMNYGQERVNQTEAILHHLEFMPSAQPEPQWIPVSERLPEEDKDVLVTVYFAGRTQKHKTGWNDHIKPSTYVDIASYYGGDWVSASDEYKVARSRHRVIAWMPLPKEYSGE